MARIRQHYAILWYATARNRFRVTTSYYRLHRAIRQLRCFRQSYQIRRVNPSSITHSFIVFTLSVWRARRFFRVSSYRAQSSRPDPSKRPAYRYRRRSWPCRVEHSILHRPGGFAMHLKNYG